MHLILLKYFCKGYGRLFILILTLTVQGCSGLLFYPYSQHVQTPQSLGLAYKDVFFITEDQIKIHSWFLPAQGDLLGSIYFLHGNAENISTHIEAVKWLPAEGYQVFLIDYRGFGRSEGTPRLPDVFLDIKAGFKEVVSLSRDRPIFLFGQSLGASLGLYFAATDPVAREKITGVISDSAFTRYFDIVHHAAAQVWLTWPVQYPAAALMNYDYNPLDVIDELAPIPVLIAHADQDSVIPPEFAVQLYSKSAQPKTLLQGPGKHIQLFNNKKYRQKLLDFLKASSPSLLY